MDVRIYLIGFSALVVTWLIFFIFSGRKIPKLYSLLLGLSPLILLYVLNPNLRIFSFHGFRHAGIVYQLLQGNIPPLNPLLAGQVLQHPWGWHCIAALFTRMFNLTPFYSFAVINIISLFLAMVLVYKISQLLCKDEKANTFSVIIALFAVTIIDLYLVRSLSSLLKLSIPFEHRGIPIVDKFSNSNGVPLGTVFFLLSLFSLTRLFQGKNLWSTILLFLFSLLGCGFLYPAFLPGIIVSTGLLCLINLFSPPQGDFARDLKKIILLAGILALGMVCLSPYLLSITSGLKSELHLFNLRWMSVKMIRFTVVTFPLLIVIFINRRYLLNNTNRTARIVLATVVLATLSCNIIFSLPLDTEVKFFMLSAMTMGILGGIAFCGLYQRFNKLVSFFIILLFLSPFYRQAQVKLLFQKDDPPVSELYYEKGRYLYSTSAEENELYQWIRNHTKKTSPLIDLQLTIPVLAQRQLFIGMDSEAPLKRAPLGMKDVFGGVAGYTSTIDSFLRFVNCYDPDLIETRQAFVETLYGANEKLTTEEMKSLFEAHENMYVVVRAKGMYTVIKTQGSYVMLPTNIIKRRFADARFTQVFRSSKGNFLVFQKENLYVKSIR